MTYFLYAEGIFSNPPIFEEYKSKEDAIRSAKELELDGWKVTLIEGKKISR